MGAGCVESVGPEDALRNETEQARLLFWGSPPVKHYGSDLKTRMRLRTYRRRTWWRRCLLDRIEPPPSPSPPSPAVDHRALCLVELPVVSGPDQPSYPCHLLQVVDCTSRYACADTCLQAWKLRRQYIVVIETCLCCK